MRIKNNFISSLFFSTIVINLLLVIIIPINTLAESCSCNKEITYQQILGAVHEYHTCHNCTCESGVCKATNFGPVDFTMGIDCNLICNCTSNANCPQPVTCSRCSNNYACQRAFWTNPPGVSCDTVTQPVTYAVDESCTNLCQAGQICNDGYGCVAKKYTCSSSGCIESASGSYTSSNCDGKCIKRCVGTSCVYNDNTSNKSCSNSTECQNVSCSRCSNNYPCKRAFWTNPPGVSCDTVTQPVTYTTDDSCGGCPLDNYTGNCRCNNNYLEKEVKHYWCNNGSCASGTEWYPDMNCGTSYYDSWSSNYCKNEDVYHKRLFYEQGCKSTSSTTCACYYIPPVYQEELVTDCPATSPCCTQNGMATCCSLNKPSCSVTASASPNPIPCGQNQTTISATGSGYTSCSGTGTFSQSSQTTYSIYCTGDNNHSDCSTTVTVDNSSCKYDCDNSGNCVIKNNGSYTTSNCENKCLAQSHRICTANCQCATVSGAGVDQCNTNTDCCAHYSCNTSTWSCYENSSGPYSSLTDCQNNCQPTVNKYSCNSNTGTCYQDTNGPYSSLTTCQNNCNISSVSIILNSDKTIVEPNQEVTFTATGNNVRESYGLDWVIDDTTQCKYHSSWTDCGKFKNCQKMSFNNSYLDLSFLDKIPLISNLIKSAQGATLTSTLTYAWSKNGTYNVLVKGKDLKGNIVTSNTVTITVQQIKAPCSIFQFTINGKTNQDQNPLLVFVNTSLKGYFSVNDSCKTCTVTSNDTWGKSPQKYSISSSQSSYTETFKIPTKGTYSFTLECVGSDPQDIATDTISLQNVKAINLPIWREIIPYLGGFLKGLIRR